MHVTRYTIHDTRYTIQDTRYTIYDTRYTIQDTRYTIRHIRTLTLHDMINARMYCLCFFRTLYIHKKYVCTCYRTAGSLFLIFVLDTYAFFCKHVYKERGITLNTDTSSIFIRVLSFKNSRGMYKRCGQYFI